MAPTYGVPNMSRRYAGIVAKPPPYMLTMTQEAQHEQHDVAARAGVGHRHVEHDAEHEVDEIGVLAADGVGQRRPEETAAHVEQAQQADEAGRGAGADRAREHLLNHRRRLAEHADAGRHVQAQHASRAARTAAS